MNKLSKWVGEFRGKRLCHYCPDTWLNGFHSNGNCMNCPKCQTTYVYNWRPTNTWPKKWVPGMGSRGDPNKLLHIQFHYQRLVDYVNQDCVVYLNLKDKTTDIILDFPKYTFSNPTMTLPYLVNFTPTNVKDKVKRILLFS